MGILNIIDELETSLHDFSLEREPGDYWYDCGILQSSAILKQFDTQDWEVLLSRINYKSLFWKLRFVECLGDLHHSYEIQAILIIIENDDEDLFIRCIDSLRSLDLSGMSESSKEMALSRIKYLSESVPLPEKSVFDSFCAKLSGLSH